MTHPIENVARRMKPHEDRVVSEERELSDKLNKLGAFIHGEQFKVLAAEDQRLLQEQDGHMRAYADVLRRRIARFTERGKL